MAGGILRKDAGIQVIAPLFDRLVDEDPKVQEEPVPFKTYSVPEVVESIARELANILNTRSSRIPYSMYATSEDLAELGISHRYGLPDFSKYDITDDYGQRLLTRQILCLVEHYEPRLSQVGVQIVGADNAKRLVVEISGIINVFPTPERFTFPVEVAGS